MSRQWLKRCAIGAMTVVMTVSSLPMAAFADPNGYNGGGNAFTNVNGEQVTIGNDAITRTFSIADGKLATLEIDNKRANTKLTPGPDSEEFIIKRTKKDAAGQQPIDQTGWTATADSEENIGEGAPHHGHASNIIDNDQSTFWHTGDCGRFSVHPTPGSRETAGTRPVSASPASARCVPTETTPSSGPARP